VNEQMRITERSRPNPAWLAVPLILFSLISLDTGIIASRTVPPPPAIYTTPILIFSDNKYMKAWLVTGALVLALFQLLTASRIYGLLRFPPGGHFYNVVHRWSGWTAIVLTLPVAYNCIFQLGLDLHAPDQRIVIHSLLGTTFYAALVCKVLFVRSTRFPGWALPIAGGVLFTILLGLWLTSAYWLFTTFGIAL